MLFKILKKDIKFRREESTIISDDKIVEFLGFEMIVCIVRGITFLQINKPWMKVSYN